MAPQVGDVGGQESPGLVLGSPFLRLDRPAQAQEPLELSLR